MLEQNFKVRVITTGYEDIRFASIESAKKYIDIVSDDDNKWFNQLASSEYTNQYSNVIEVIYLCDNIPTVSYILEEAVV